ncbi:hypothetical protein RQP46_008296 [Phenoliferia psychrophenolica]
MLDEEADFDFGAWCPVCDRAIPALEAASVGPPGASPGPSHAQPASPDLQRAPSGSSHGHGTSSAGANGKGKERRKKDAHQANGVAGPAQAGGLPQRRNKSSTKLHHATSRHHHGRTNSHSQTNLAPLTAHTPPLPTPTPPLSDAANQSAGALNPPTSLYCSEECRKLDEMRSRLAFADLGPSAPRLASHSPAPPPPIQHPPSPGAEVGDLMASMSRRRLSGTSLPVASPPQQHLQWGSTSSLASRSHSSTSLSQQGPAPGLDFSTRRHSNNRGATEGGYSYRPSLMQRVPSSDDGLPQLGNGAGWSRARGSSDSLASMGEADERSDRGFSDSSQGSSNAPPPPSPRTLEKRSSDPTMTIMDGDLASFPHLENATARQTSPKMSRSTSTARRPPRTNSSASLALMGTSLGKSYVPRSLERTGGWSAPKRSESTASLSGLVATGKILPVSSLAPSIPSNTTFSPRQTIPRLSTSPSSPSSTSSFARSHSSTRSSQRSTAGSSEHPDHRTSLPYDYGNFYPKREASSSSLAGYSSRSPQPEPFLSSSAGSRSTPAKAGQRPSASRGRRSNQGLIMTPSASSLSGAGSSFGEAAASDMGRPAHERRSSSTAERTPTQSLSKATSIHAASHTDIASLDPETTPLASAHAQRRRSNESRAMSTPGTARRPHPPDFTRPSISSSSPPVNAAGVNPSLSYLYPHGAASFGAAGGVPSSPPSMLANKSRNWSWDHLPVPTYTALTPSGAAPQAGKERKRLFYFSDVE